jgi:hypothetical protein
MKYREIFAFFPKIQKSIIISTLDTADAVLYETTPHFLSHRHLASASSKTLQNYISTL